MLDTLAAHDGRQAQEHNESLSYRNFPLGGSVKLTAQFKPAYLPLRQDGNIVVAVHCGLRQKSISGGAAWGFCTGRTQGQQVAKPIFEN